MEKSNSNSTSSGGGIFSSLLCVLFIGLKLCGVIRLSLPYCREYRIGLASKLGIKYDPADVLRFKKCVETTVGDRAKIVWKKSIIDKIKKSQ